MPIHPTFNFYIMLPTQNFVMHPKLSLTHPHASQSNGHVGIQHVLHLQSNTMAYHMSLTYLFLSRH
jgi:hypothetical protein